MNFRRRFFIFLLVLIAKTQVALAVPPPDFLFNVGAQIVQVFSITILFLSAILASVSQFAKVYFYKLKHRKILLAGLIFAVVLISLATAYFYGQYEQNKTYREWIDQSAVYGSDEVTTDPSLDKLKMEDQTPWPEKSESAVVPEDKNLPLSVSNTDFQQAISAAAALVEPLFVLDAREDEEFEIGNFPDSTHVRFADLLAGEWIRIPTDKVVYVFCWSGIRGKEVAEFLRSKKIVARYIEKGADDWVAQGGTWNGGIRFSSNYTEDRYQRVFTLDEIKKHISEGTVLVDSRAKAKFDARHIPGSINIPIIYTPSVNIEEALAQVPEGKSVITICDDFVSCFDAKVTGVKLEKKGHEFLGRYNKPWEYE